MHLVQRFCLKLGFYCTEVVNLGLLAGNLQSILLSHHQQICIVSNILSILRTYNSLSKLGFVNTVGKGFFQIRYFGWQSMFEQMRCHKKISQGRFFCISTGTIC